MLIECRQRRKRRDDRIGRKDNDVGIKPKLFGKRYWFRPQPELLTKLLGDQTEFADLNAHICEIEDERAIARFLELAEQYNEYGRPPKIAKEPDPPPGQPAIHTELIDSDDTLGEPDQKKSDPLAAAKEIQREWVADQLDKPVTVFVKDISGLDDDELELLLASERSGKRRKGVTEALKKALAPEIIIPDAGASSTPAEISME